MVDSIGSDIHNRDLRQIDLFAEQLDLTAALVRAGGLARGRIALVAIDNLAEVLLYRHLQFTFGASEEMGRLTAQRYDRRARERLRQDFDRRVTLAATEHTGTFSWSYPKPILDRVDATIFRVAHRYRNGVYHEDRHNAALLDPLTRLSLVAVGRAWCRAQPEVSMGGYERQLRGLNYISRHAQAGGLALPHAVVALSNYSEVSRSRRERSPHAWQRISRGGPLGLMRLRANSFDADLSLARTRTCSAQLSSATSTGPTPS